MKTKSALLVLTRACNRGESNRKVGFIFASFALCAFALIQPSFAATNDLTSALQKGLFEEEANHNLEAAAQAYQNVSAQFDKDRKLAATAIFRMGEVYRKQGKTNEAVSQYERIVREFSDQSTLVTLSRQNLGSLRPRPTSNVDQLISVEALRAHVERTRTQVAAIDALPKTNRIAALAGLFSNDQVIENSRKRRDSAAKQLDVLRQSNPEDSPVIVNAKRQLEQSQAAIDEHALKLEKDARSLLALLEKSLKEREVAPDQAVDFAANSTVASTDEEEKEIRRIQAMIQNSPDLINAPGGAGFTPLHTAANLGQLIVARFLLDNGADVNCRNGNQETPLTLAAARGHKAMVELLLARKAEANAVGGGGYTALHQAALYGFKTVAEVLLAKKANANAITIAGATPLHLAASAGNNSLVELLLANGAKVTATDSQGSTPLMSAAAGGRAEVVSTLVAAKSDVDAQNGAVRTALSFAVNKKSLDTVKALLAAKADPNAGQLDLPLAEAVFDNQLETAELLLQAGADPNAARKFSTSISQPGQNFFNPSGSYGPYTPLQIAVGRGNSKSVILLFQHKADPNTKDPWSSPGAPLIEFALNNPESLKGFLDAGADANGNTRNGEPLLVASADKPETVKLLLDHGAKPDARGKEDQTALYMAVYRNSKEAVKELLAVKADANLANVQGVTPLHMAAYGGSRELAEMLVAHGADLNAKQRDGQTPLHWALSIGQKGIGAKAMVELLLEKGANPNIQNERGQTPLDIAKATRASVIAESLRAHGALDELPDLSSIRLARAGVEQTIVFRRDTNGVNHFTLLEAIRNYYPRPDIRYKSPVGPTPIQYQQNPTVLPFPDFTRLTILRRTDATGGKQKEIEVNVANGSNGFDPGKDVTLQFGDIVEVREREHTLSEYPVGLSQEQDEQLMACLRKKVSFVVKGHPEEVLIEGRSDAAYLSVALQQDIVKRVLRSSSDLSRLKIKRTDAATKKAKEIPANAQDFMAGKKPVAEDIWLRDGDVIEVPDKP